MRLRYFHVDAFAPELFRGNPAGVCPLHKWLPDELLLKIAAENNLAETAFFVPEAGGFHLRWFTPAVEIDLCGHATLAAGHILITELGHRGPIRFRSQSGELSVEPEHKMLFLNFPARPPRQCEMPEWLEAGLGAKPNQVYKSRDYLAVFTEARQVAALQPDFAALSRLDCLGIIATAPGGPGDFVSRFFAPAAGIDEDPVTGSAHCTLIPFWAERLGKYRLSARQVSRRGGELECRLEGDRVAIGGKCFTYLRGEIEVPG